jgi:hypothetical protein
MLAAEPGFEPGQTDSKSAVLPLHNSAPGSNDYAEGRGRTDMKVALQRFLRPSRLPVPPLRLEPHMHIDCKNGAEDEIRTRDFLLGKEAFYH